jgi:hypothetical protein
VKSQSAEMILPTISMGDPDAARCIRRYKASFR